MIESRRLAHRVFAPPTVREKWTAELGGAPEFMPAETGPGAFEVTLRDEKTSVQKPGDQRTVRFDTTGAVMPQATPEGRYVARGQGVELSWSTTGKYVHDMVPSVDHLHTEIRLQGPGWCRSLEDKTTSNDPSPYRWAPVTRDGRALVQTSKRTIECLDRHGNTVFMHEGTPWSEYDVPPVIGADGRILISDRSHNTLTSYRPDGTSQWERSFFSKNVRCAPLPLEDGSTLVAVQSEQNGVTSLHRLDDRGETVEQWSIPGSFVAGMTLAQDGTLVVATNDQPRVAGFDAAGQLRWEHALEDKTFGSPRLLPDGSLMLVGQHGHVTALEVSDPRTAPDLPAAEELAAEIQEGPDFVNVAGVRLRRR